MGNIQRPLFDCNLCNILTSILSMSMVHAGLSAPAGGTVALSLPPPMVKCTFECNEEEEEGPVDDDDEEEEEEEEEEE